jgi:hypothetical protein
MEDLLGRSPVNLDLTPVQADAVTFSARPGTYD